MRSVQEESIVNGCSETISAGTTQKDPSSLKSASNGRNHESVYDLKTRIKPSSHHRQQSKSMLENKQKASVQLSQKNQSSSIIREEGSRVSGSSNKGRSFLRRVDNEEEEGSFSQILANEVSMNQLSQKGKDTNSGF